MPSASLRYIESVLEVALDVAALETLAAESEQSYSTLGEWKGANQKTLCQVLGLLTQSFKF